MDHPDNSTSSRDPSPGSGAGLAILFLGMSKPSTELRKSDGATYPDWRDAVSQCHPLAEIVPEWTWRRCYDENQTPWEAAADNV
jgi:hypothetical protein